jgi:DNA-binding NarL/FixJ family response regulator
MDEHQRVRVLLVEDHDMVARGIEAALVDEGIEVVGRAADSRGGIAQYDELHPDVVVMDYRLPDGVGTDAASRIRERDADATVLLVTGVDEPNVIADAIECGCSGFVSKDASIEHLADAIRAVAQGAAVFPAEHLARALRRDSDESRLGDDLTGREREILTMLATGRSTDEIAEQLFLSTHTVRNHVRNVLTKLRARTKLEAVIIAARAGIVDLSPQS